MANEGTYTLYMDPTADCWLLDIWGDKHHLHESESNMHISTLPKTNMTMEKKHLIY